MIAQECCVSNARGLHADHMHGIINELVYALLKFVLMERKVLKINGQVFLFLKVNLHATEQPTAGVADSMHLYVRTYEFECLPSWSVPGVVVTGARCGSQETRKRCLNSHQNSF